jgi:hypothetical protein
MFGRNFVLTSFSTTVFIVGGGIVEAQGGNGTGLFIFGFGLLIHLNVFYRFIANWIWKKTENLHHSIKMRFADDGVST